MKKHPIIRDLKINEDGTEIIYKNKPITPRTYHKKGRNNYAYRNVHFMGRTHSVAKLVCECYNGMRKDLSFTIQRKDFNPDNDHYTNLFWGKQGSRVRTSRTKRCKNSKIKDADLPVVLKRIKKGETLLAIAKSYDTSQMTIQRIKQRYITNPQKVFKEAIINAKTKERVNTICARYLGYMNTADASQKMGNHEFLMEVDKLIKNI